ncbi:2-amino-4-hydroxy-6-hydroxymethyldihydropteridine diphosphokinase [Alteromonas pelagimontana]|uniref:2-amino-4-hydroxy-6-hydroxymethyldihydropteridine pyrophosphokinase n=1 Tax=Alteromonas pelagimontana TaxID=1858656 RepID=A0A6M4MGW4_9ALTE|nr:2-amino-4-hydroxy-6-hydroxymethyldihydropteridine diphosphokinase [Alteromonas pelagimontana]QJR81436.1 2-amino-4-hydroxy-6-hydroxymethyldihydropteridine diphosphokinase [Alteromonas pelagimontana]
MSQKEHVYIGLGSNLGQSTDLLNSAVDAIGNLADTRVLKKSSLYISAPMGPQDQPDFINSVCLIETALSPHPLLAQLQQIENSYGRERKGKRWGPRTLDLDVLLYGNQEVNTDDLTIPHYGMAEREFVLVPLFEIAPNMIMPDGNPLSQWVAKCSLEGLKRIRASNQQ